MTPDRIFIPSVSPMCFWGCREHGTLLYIWWTCYKAIRFWTHVYAKICSALDVTIAATPGKPYYMNLIHLYLRLSGNWWSLCSWPHDKLLPVRGDNLFLMSVNLHRGSWALWCTRSSLQFRKICTPSPLRFGALE